MAHIGRPSRGSTAFIRAMGVKVIFDTSQPATTLTAPALIPTDNFNGDGHGDILWQNSNGTPAIWLLARARARVAVSPRPLSAGRLGFPD